MATTPTTDPAAPDTDQQPVKPVQATTKPVLDQVAVAAATVAANVNGGQGVQPGGRQDPPLI